MRVWFIAVWFSAMKGFTNHGQSNKRNTEKYRIHFEEIERSLKLW